MAAADALSDQRRAELAEAVGGLPHCRELGLSVVELALGAATLRLDYDPRLAGDPETGVLHGGVITTILDTASGLAVFAGITEDTALATLDLRIDYLRPAAPGKPVFGRAECYKLTRHVAFARGEAYQDDAAEPIAHCVGTFMLGAGLLAGKKEG